jgi:hypothetical protein
MTLQQVGDTYQGAAYPFSLDQPLEGPPLLGPIVCSVSPGGDLFVGGLRDSGWGGANNVGEIVRLRLRQPKAGDKNQLDRLPNGIVEMRATSSGFTIDFVDAVSTSRALDPANYSLSSYTRESTPAYGGPDLNQRTEKISGVSLSSDARQVTLRLGEMRPGYVYELHVKNLTDGEPSFFPSEAHYTLRKIPR